MEQFCYWDAKSLEDTMIMMIMIVIQVGIAIITVSRLRKIGKMGRRSKKIIIIYVLIVFWCALLFNQQFYSIFVFFVYLKDDLTQSVQSYSQMYVRLDILPGFIVQTIFLIICKFYYEGLVDAIEICHMARWEQKYITYLNGYFVLRTVAQATGIVLVNIYAETDKISFFSQVNIWILISDSVIMNVYLVLSLKIYLKRLNHIVSIEEKELRKLKMEYFLMIITSFTRVVIDILFSTALPLAIESNSASNCIGPFSTHVINSIFYQIIGNIVNHIFPIIWVLKIYTFQAQKQPAIEKIENDLITSYCY